jgi:hypothetical protein
LVNHAWYLDTEEGEYFSFIRSKLADSAALFTELSYQSLIDYSDDVFGYGSIFDTQLAKSGERGRDVASVQ